MVRDYVSKQIVSKWRNSVLFLSHMFFQGFTPICYLGVISHHLLICKFVACHQAICDALLIRICNPSKMDVSLDL